MGGPRGQKWGVKQGGFEGGKIGGLEAYPGAMGLRDPVVLGGYPHMFPFQKFTCTPIEGFWGFAPSFRWKQRCVLVLKICVLPGKGVPRDAPRLAMSSSHSRRPLSI